MHELAERVLRHIRREELLCAGDRVGVAVSGGIDSVALLRLLIELRRELGIVLWIVHFNHKLRGAESDADQEFVAQLARTHGLEFHGASGDVTAQAVNAGSGVEAAARELRYGFFRRLLGEADVDDNEIESDPRGLKPESLAHLDGTTEVVPFPKPGATEVVPFSTTAPTSAEMPSQILNKIATGHTLDDQAETVLMRLIRGTGLRGLGGIYPRIIVEHDIEDAGGNGHGEIVRPLLEIRRCELEKYLADLKQPWREDSTNTDSKFTRNRVRKLLMPLLEREFNPAVVEGFAELAEIARDEEDYWENEISGWLGTVVQWSQPEWVNRDAGLSRGLVQIRPTNAKKAVVETPPGVSGEVFRSAQDDRVLGWTAAGSVNASVSRPWLVTESRAVQRRVLKVIGEEAGIPLEFKHIEKILRFAAENGPAGKELSLPLGWRLVREPEAMVFLAPDLQLLERIPDYEYLLAVPGRVVVPELGIIMEALRVRLDDPNIDPESEHAEYNPQQLLRADLLRGPLTVRNWRAGDRFWPAHTKSPKKIKELLQERHVAQPERRLWPVAVSGDEIVWMRGFPAPARFRVQPGQESVLIREIAWAAEQQGNYSM